MTKEFPQVNLGNVHAFGDDLSRLFHGMLFDVCTSASIIFLRAPGNIFLFRDDLFDLFR